MRIDTFFEVKGAGADSRLREHQQNGTIAQYKARNRIAGFVRRPNRATATEGTSKDKPAAGVTLIGRARSSRHRRARSLVGHDGGQSGRKQRRGPNAWRSHKRPCRRPGTAKTTGRPRLTGMRWGTATHVARKGPPRREPQVTTTRTACPARISCVGPEDQVTWPRGCHWQVPARTPRRKRRMGEPSPRWERTGHGVASDIAAGFHPAPARRWPYCSHARRAASVLVPTSEYQSSSSAEPAVRRPGSSEPGSPATPSARATSGRRLPAGCRVTGRRRVPGDARSRATVPAGCPHRPGDLGPGDRRDASRPATQGPRATHATAAAGSIQRPAPAGHEPSA